MRTIVMPPLERLAERLVDRGWQADHVTLGGLVAALTMPLAIAGGWLWLALALVGISRLADGLDGAIARRNGMTDFGGLLDIVCDFAFYAAVPVGFALLAPADNGLAAAVLLASFYLNAASFLGYAALAEKRGLRTDVRGKKSLYFTTGLAEGTETIAVFVAMLLVPGWFIPLAYGFAALCLVTCISRVLLAFMVFSRDKSGS